jgi:hypothetical protein
MDEAGSAAVQGRISSSGFNRWLARAVNSCIDAALRLKIGAGDMNEVDFADGHGPISSSGFNRWLASCGKFRHLSGARTEDPGL